MSVLVYRCDAPILAPIAAASRQLVVFRPAVPAECLAVLDPDGRRVLRLAGGYIAPIRAALTSLCDAGALRLVLTQRAAAGPQWWQRHA